MTTDPVDGRPYAWPTDAEFRALIGRTPRQGDRHILLALRMHDLEPNNRQGATPGYKRLAELTGLGAGYVRNRLSALRRVGAIHTAGVSGLLTSYFIVPPGLVTSSGDTASHPVTSEGDTAPSATIPPPVTCRGDRQGDIFPPRVTYLSPPEVHSKGKKYLTVSPKGLEKPGQDTWLTPFIAAWKDQYEGEPNPGRLAKALRPVWEKQAADALLDAWRRYLASTPAKFNPTPEKFAETFGAWSPKGGPRALEVVEV